MDYKEKIGKFEQRFKTLMYDYYDGATIIKKLIYNQKLMDRYYSVLEDFKSLKSNIYSNRHIEKLMNSKTDNTVLVINIYRSRALGMLSIADAISRISTNPNLGEEHLKTCAKLRALRDEMIVYANNNLRFSNMLAKDIGYEEYNNPML